MVCGKLFVYIDQSASNRAPCPSRLSNVLGDTHHVVAKTNTAQGHTNRRSDTTGSRSRIYTVNLAPDACPRLAFYLVVEAAGYAFYMFLRWLTQASSTVTVSSNKVINFVRG
jgi:hypothetical protein